MMLDLTFTERLKPEPLSDFELGCMDRLDAVDFGLAQEKLDMIVHEARDVFVQSGVSSMLESGDCAVGLYTAKGDLVTAASGSYLYAVCGQPQIKYICHRWDEKHEAGIMPGDIFYANDALFGGIHNADQFAFMPIFYGNTLIAWSSAACHQSETGASEPGGMPVTARSRFDEGLKVSPIKIGEGYVLRDDLLEMMANVATRSPHMQIIDARARVIACDRVRVRVEELCSERGLDFIVGVFTRILRTTAEGVRRKISGWVDGIFRGVVFTDHIGIDEGLVKVSCELTKKGDRLTVDFTGTSPETPGPYNAFKHTMIAHNAIYFYGIPFHDFPVCAGIWDAIDCVVPAHTCLSAGPEAAVANAPLICSLSVCLLHLTMSKLLFASGLPELVTAPFGNNGDAFVMSGTNQWGASFTDLLAYPLNCEGGGARCNADGVDAWGFPWGPWGRGPDVETEEEDKPHIHLFQKILKDSCGHGKYRGGCGITVAWAVKGASQVSYQSIVKSSRVQMLQSFFGGYPPAPHPGVNIRASDVFSLMAEGSRELPEDVYELLLNKSIKGKYEITTNVRPARAFEEGDIFVGCSHGGVGYGDVLERNPLLVIRDLKNEIISHWVAQNIYYVVYDPDTFVVDLKATESKRKKVREMRLRQGMSYGDFIAQWSALKPDSAILRYYGSWPSEGSAEELEESLE